LLIGGEGYAFCNLPFLADMLSEVSLGCTPVKPISVVGLLSLNGLILEKLQAVENRFDNKYQATGNKTGTGLCCGTGETPF